MCLFLKSISALFAACEFITIDMNIVNYVCLYVCKALETFFPEKHCIHDKLWHHIC